jgi:hypothetical protein
MWGPATTTPTPVAFQSKPSLDAVLQAVNRNSAQVQTLQTDGARLSMRMSPAVNAELVIERPKRIRFKAGTQLTGAVVDLGSNDELFWFWSPLDRNPALYFARHDEFARSTAAQTMPVEPQWLIDAMGLVDFDPMAKHEGPYDHGRDTIEIRSYYPTATGQVTKITHIHNRFAWVLGQQIYDANGKLVATTKASNHQYFALQQVALPRKVEFELAMAQLHFEVDTTDYRINQPLSNPELVFALPTSDIPNTPVVDLLDPQGLRGGARGSRSDVGAAPSEDWRGSLGKRNDDRSSRLPSTDQRLEPNDVDQFRPLPSTDLDRQWAPAPGTARLPQRGLEQKPWR